MIDFKERQDRNVNDSQDDVVLKILNDSFPTFGLMQLLKECAHTVESVPSNVEEYTKVRLEILLLKKIKYFCDKLICRYLTTFS